MDTVMSINLDGLTNGLLQLKQSIYKFNPIVICIQDPPIYQPNHTYNVRRSLLNDYSIGAGGDDNQHRGKITAHQPGNIPIKTGSPLSSVCTLDRGPPHKKR